MDNETLKNELEKYVQGTQDIESISYDLEYSLSQANAIFLINEALTDTKYREAIDDLLTDINYHKLNRIIDALIAEIDDLPL